jgi:hypothetical protein
MKTTTSRIGYSNRKDRRAKAAQKARLDAISEGLQEEVAAFNEAIQASKKVRFPVREGSLTSGRKVERARYGWDGIWVECANYGGSYALGNDSRWAELLTIAGVERDQRTA